MSKSTNALGNCGNNSMKSPQTMRSVNAATLTGNGARRSRRDNAASSDVETVNVRFRGARCLAEAFTLSD